MAYEEDESKLENDSLFKKVKNWKTQDIYKIAPFGKDFPDQGFKIAISADKNNAEKVFDIVSQLLEKEKVEFKIVNSLENLEEQSKGNQVGKFITIYPSSDEEAAKISVKVDRALERRGLKGPPCKEDRPYGNSGLVFLRGGGLKVFDLIRPDGTTEPDVRTPEKNIDPKTGKPIRKEIWKADWMPDIFELINKYRAETELSCPKCGKLVTTDQKYCRNCGLKIPIAGEIAELPCPNCGKPITPNQNYCRHCGTKIPIAGKISKEPKKFIPFGSLLKDKSGTFPRVGKIPKLDLFERLKNFFWPSKVGKIAKEITTEQEALQELTDKLAFELSDWWGIPRDKIKERIPKIETISSDEMYFMTGSGRNLGLYSFEKNKIFLNSYVASEKHLAIYPEQDEKYTLYSVRGVIGEEVGHFIENFVKTDLNINLNDIDVSEFFGLTSSLFIAEKIPQLFKEEYRRYLQEAANFSKEKKNLEIRLADLEKQKMEAEQPQKPVLGIKPGTNYKSSLARFASKETIKNQIKECQTQIEHLSYYPAVAYYYEMRKMTPQERYKLITMQQVQIKSEIIKPISDRLTEIVNSILAEDNLLRLEREISLMPETSTKQVAEAVSETEIEDLEEYEGQPPEESSIETGEIMEEYPTEEYSEEEQFPEQELGGEEEQPETEEFEQPQEEIQEPYPESEQAPSPPQISINIPKKVPKDVAKKLESMGIKLPKKMIKN